MSIEVPFMTAAFGGQEKIRARILEHCEKCGGSGLKPGSNPKSCNTCGGAGVTNNAQKTPFGVVMNQQICGRCGGAGKDSASKCDTCRGNCCMPKNIETMMKIPAGIESGVKLRVKGAGSVGKLGGARGDLYVKVSVKQHNRFRRDGANLYSDVQVSFLDAILGTKVSLEGIDGPLSIEIPAGTQPDDRISVRGKGVVKYNSENRRGDHVVQIKVQIPKAINDNQRKIFMELNKTLYNDDDTVK